MVSLNNNDVRGYSFSFLFFCGPPAAFVFVGNEKYILIRYLLEFNRMPIHNSATINVYQNEKLMLFSY